MPLTIPFTLRVIVQGDPINEYLKGAAMKTKHTMIVKWDMVHEEWTAHSDLFGRETSPVGIGESPADAINDLIEQLDEMEKRSEP